MKEKTVSNQWLRRERERRGWSRSSLAEMLGVADPKTIGRWERGVTFPSAHFQRKLQALFELNAEQIGLLPRGDDEKIDDVALTVRQEPTLPLSTSPPHATFWNIPFRRNPFFTGREEVLEQLHTFLRIDQAVGLTQIYAIHGLGGIGKTQIALEYAYRYASEYSAAFWIEAETMESVVSALLRIAELLYLPESKKKEQQHIVVAVQRWLVTHSNWLLIWDNLEDLELLQLFLPPTRQGAILLTTRRQALGTLAQGINLMPMRQAEGILFVLRRAKVIGPKMESEQIQPLVMRMPAEYAAASKLVTEMGGLPLAMDQAGAYIEETGCGFADYLRRYELQHVLLLDRRGSTVSDHPQAVTTTFQLTMEQVEQGQPVAAEILRICALLYAEAIPEELFIVGATHLGPILAPLASDPSQFDQAIAVLRNYSLVRRSAQTHTLSIHRLVQTVLRNQMGEPEQIARLKQIIAGLDAVHPEVTYNTWEQCERLLPHVLAVATSFPDPMGDQKLTPVLRKTADYLYERAQYKEAEPLYAQSLRILQQTRETDYLEQATLLNRLANLYREQGKYELAELLYQQSFSTLEQVLGTEHLNLTSPLNGLALLYFRQGKHKEAELLYKRALSILKQELGPEHPDLATSLNGLGSLYFRQGKYEEVEPFYKQSLTILEQALGPEHPDLAAPLNGLADLYQEQQKYEEAEPFYQRALIILEQILGPEHPRIATLLSGLADLYSNQRKDELAEALYKRALSILEQSLGPEHPHVAYTLNNLADLYNKQGKEDKLEPLYKQALSILEQALGSEHPHVATFLNELADLYAKQSKDEQAELLYKQAQHIMEQHQGQRHPETARSMAGLARLYEKQGKREQEEYLLQQAYCIFEQSLGLEHSETIKTRKAYQSLLAHKEKDKCAR
ncbi:helix-turn-helix domain-containing protein [Dictyobacter arantiisoli]|uniref:Tetratricopeptide repeat protein n=1 Tax=Dictyobacter arantiisoli TaxID=2014874 RepID=A0A5A5T6V7_9CHLR|nr:helix-turn-helix domain-containing protein [Dictyobacter arantiisoli]GCF07108.1 tetratricopeptide repeat protein [Dictyobacter arantiisoli]